MSTPEYFQKSSEALRADAEHLQQLQDDIEKLYARWDELEAKKALSEKKDNTPFSP